MMTSIYLGNNQKKANALIEGSGLKMLGVDDFDQAAKTVSTCMHLIAVHVTNCHCAVPLLSAP